MLSKAGSPCDIAPRSVILNGVQRFSIVDAIVVIRNSNTNAAAKTWSRVPDDIKKEVWVGAVTHQFRGRGQAPQAVTTYEGVLKLIMHLGGPRAAYMRTIMARTIMRVAAGDHSLIQEIKDNASSSNPLSMMARASMASGSAGGASSQLMEDGSAGGASYSDVVSMASGSAGGASSQLKEDGSAGGASSQLKEDGSAGGASPSRLMDDGSAGGASYSHVVSGGSAGGASLPYHGPDFAAVAASAPLLDVQAVPLDQFVQSKLDEVEAQKADLDKREEDFTKWKTQKLKEDIDRANKLEAKDAKLDRDVKTWTARFDQRNKNLVAQEKQLEEKGKALDSKIKQLSTNKTNLEAKIKDLDERKADLNAKIKDMEERKADLDRSAAALTERSSDIERESTALEERLLDVERESMALEEREKKFNEKDRLLKIREDNADGYDLSLDLRADTLQKSTEALEQREKAVLEKERSLQTLQEQLNEKEQALNASQEQLIGKERVLNANQEQLAQLPKHNAPDTGFLKAEGIVADVLAAGMADIDSKKRPREQMSDIMTAAKHILELDQLGLDDETKQELKRRMLDAVKPCA